MGEFASMNNVKVMLFVREDAIDEWVNFHLSFTHLSD
jgi:hypothetical protein